MVETPGICTQTTTCEVARSGRMLTVPLGSPFVCPDCGRGLVPPVQATEPSSAKAMPAAVPLALVGAGLLVLGGAVFLGRELGATSAAPPAQVASESHTVALPTVPPPAAQARLAAAKPATAAPAPPVQVAAAKTDAVAVPAKPAEAPPAVTAMPAGQPVSAPPPAATSAAVTVASAVPVRAMPAATAPAVPPTAALPIKLPAASVPVTIAVAAPPPAIADQSFSPVPVTGGNPVYPAELAADGRPGRVAVNCQILPDGTPSSCHAAATKGGPAFAAATLAWLAHAHVRFRPVILHGHPVAAAHSWTVTIEESPSALAAAKLKQQETAEAEAGKAELAAVPPAPAPRPAVSLPVQPIIARQVIPPAAHAAPDRPFSSAVVAGGVPAFPPAYEDTRPGAVTVQCTIEEDGAPTLCHIRKAVGGSAFGKSVQSWLDSGRVRFHPVTVGGRAVPSEESWTIVFNSMPER